jgi:hypothetical protein
VREGILYAERTHLHGERTHSIGLSRSARSVEDAFVHMLVRT